MPASNEPAPANGMPASAAIALEEDAGAQLDIAAFHALDADAFHALLYPLLTCAVCRNVLADPVTLQCGNTLCRNCVPAPVDTAPATADSEAPTGPYFWTLDPEHGRRLPGGFPPERDDPEKWIPQTMRERFECPFSCSRKHHSRQIPTNFVLQRTLDSIVTLPVYTEKPPPPADPVVVATKIHAELDCQICYLLLHDPLTTPCGHTFCRTCLLRTSDHAIHCVCPTCRSPVLLPTETNTPQNKLINTLIHTLFPNAAAERASCEISERHSPSSRSLDVPIFVCTLALPSVTCFLHIFEPRYRLMLRRCMAGSRAFGMVLPRRGTRYLHEAMEMEYLTPSDGAELPGRSRATFMKYGTMLEIRDVQMLPDGRSLVETVGRERFEIEQWSVRDGYIVAKTHVLPDLEPTVYIAPPSASALTSSVLAADGGAEGLSTMELIFLTRCFVQSLRNVAWTPAARMRENEVDGVLGRLDRGGDAVKFAWWVGSKIPVEEGEGYSLLLQTGVRELFVVIGRWIGEMERQSW